MEKDIGEKLIVDSKQYEKTGGIKVKKNWLNKIKRNIALGLVASTTMVSTIVPVLGDEVQQPQVSGWSIGILNEGEKYGIYPMEWYTDGFQGGITEDKLNILLTNVDAKLGELNLDKNQVFTPIVYEKDGTRGSVLVALYNSVASYKLPDELGNNQESAIEYMQKRSILNGTNKGLDLGASCTVEQAAVFASRLIEDTYNAVGAGSKGLIWEVKHGGNTIYLLGSIHAGDTSLYPMHKNMKDAFEASDVLIVEANVLDPQGTEELMKIGMYADGTKLQDHVPEETYAQYTEFLGQMGLPTDVFDGFKPWFAGLQLAVMAGTDSDSLQEAAESAALGIDMYFLTNSMLTGKPVAELEGMIYQANLFDGLSQEMQEHFFKQSLDIALNPDSEAALESGKLFHSWLEQWYAGDVDGFASSYVAQMEGEQSEIDEMLLGKRDENMANKLAELLEKEDEATYFVVVGALHLVTEGMVVDQLKDKGYAVRGFWE